MEKTLVPRVGVGVLILKDGRVLVGQRKSSIGNGFFALPGGHLEFAFLISTMIPSPQWNAMQCDAVLTHRYVNLVFAGETWEQCAAREVEEETGLVIHNIQFAWVTNTVMLEGPRPSHYVTIFMKSELKDPEQEPQNLEPDKCEGWDWVDWPHIPQPVFIPLQSLLDSKVDIFEK